MAALFFGAVVCLTPAVPRSAPPAQQRIALVIGNGGYPTSPLKNPLADVTDLAATLQKVGFDVRLLKDAPLKKMEEAITEFGRQLRGGGVGLFYFAGHGLQVNGINYLVPIGATINKESDIKYETVDAGKILDEMTNAGNNLNIIIFDACRDNPYARSFRGATRGLAIVSAAAVGTIIAYSTSPGNVAADGDGRNSPYASALLDFLPKPGLSIEQVFKNVRARLTKETGGKQIPWELSSLQADFFFTGGDAPRQESSWGESAGTKAGGGAPVSAPSSTDYLREEMNKLEQEQLIIDKNREFLDTKKAIEEKRRKIAEAAERLEIEKREMEQRSAGRPAVDTPVAPAGNRPGAFDCQEIMMKFSLGDPLTPAEKSFLGSSCKRK